MQITLISMAGAIQILVVSLARERQVSFLLNMVISCERYISVEDSIGDLKLFAL